MPTELYYAIVDAGPVNRGLKSQTYCIPPEYYCQANSTVGQVSIQAALVGPRWTLIFSDHNVMITFHVMALHKPCTCLDFQPNSKVSFNHIYYWKAMWSRFISAVAISMECNTWSSAFNRTCPCFGHSRSMASFSSSSPQWHTHLSCGPLRSENFQRLWCSGDMWHAFPFTSIPINACSSCMLTPPTLGAVQEGSYQVPSWSHPNCWG